MPENCINDVGIRRIDAHVVAARVLVLVENLLERLSAVGGAEDSALCIRSVWMTKHGDEETVGIFGIDVDVRDHLAVTEPQVRPRFARVGGLVHPVAGCEIGANDSRAASHIDDVRVRGRDCDGADGAR